MKKVSLKQRLQRTRFFNDIAIKQTIGERQASYHLKGLGYNLIRVTKFDSEIEREVLDISGLERKLGDVSKRKKVISTLKSIPSGHPDFLCIKEKKILFVEVKTNKSEVRENQKEAHDFLRNKGFDVQVIRFEVGWQAQLISSG